MNRLRLAAVTLAAAAGVVLGGCVKEPSGVPLEPARDSCPSVRPTMGLGSWHGPCFRPYADGSPFNRPLPSQPRVHPRSDEVVARLTGFGPLQHLLAGQAGTDMDFGRPTYYSREDDPVFTLRCLAPKSECEIDGERIRIPDRARPAAGSDAHMTVVDQRSGWEYDLWRVRDKPRGGGTLQFVRGGKTSLDGDGLGSRAGAARDGNLAGILRAEELAAERIDHALLLVVRCDSGGHVFPASEGGRPCGDLGLSERDAPPMGARFALDMSDAEIDALDVPGWKRSIVRAIARYGMYVGDTGGTWGIKEESGLTYTSFGQEDRWVALANRERVPYFAPDATWVFNLRDGIDWEEQLRMIDPCEATGSC